MRLSVLIAGVTLGLCLAMAGAWGLQRRLGNGGWADVVWSYATAAAGVAYSLVPTAGSHLGARALLVGALIAAWGLRLGGHLWRRTRAETHEDRRYAQFRLGWGAAFEQRMFGFLQLQALAAALLALAMLAAVRNPAPFPRWSDFAGLTVLAVSVAGEGLADTQLSRFKAANSGGVCDVGLWASSRHPNYFFEWLGWIAYAVIAIGPDGARPWSYVALIGPVCMFALLRYGSGVPPTEAAMAASRGEAFARYQARVSAFFPLPPRAPDLGGAA